MIIYASNKRIFHDDMLSGKIEDKILLMMRQKSRRGVGVQEVASWRNSLLYMSNVLQDPEIPENAGVAIEYHIPNSSKRIDFIISGKRRDKNECLVVVELKQWTSAKATTKPSIVKTSFKHGEQEVAHPSYQAWSYSRLIEDFNEVVQDEGIQVKPCAYLHNYSPDGVIDGESYKEDIERAPLFLKEDALKLRQFIKQWVRYGDDSNVLYRIDNGKIRPSKSLANSLVSLLKGNSEFTLIDEQKIAYETALELLRTSKVEGKQVFIIEGGPGTGKSVLAINLLVEIIRRGNTCQYVTKNAAPRAVYEAMLVGHYKKSQISNLFIGSGSFTESESDTFDALIVDEAHRLNERSGLFGEKGENQIKELINAARFTVLFIDEDQRVTMKDIGRKDEIKKWARLLGADVSEIELVSQFRCNGSDSYIAWLDNTLEIRETANTDLSDVDFEFRVYDSPTDLYHAILEKNRERNRARLVAGYCWDWKSKNKSGEDVFDIEIPEYGFKIKWNLSTDGMLWILEKDSVNEVGCIHTCQGLELDYVGVIIGPDLVVRDGRMVCRPEYRARTDQSIKGLKKLRKEDPDRAGKLASLLIKNTYRTLMTRGMKGCFLYCTDPETQRYFAGLSKSISSKPEMLAVAAPKKNYSN